MEVEALPEGHSTTIAFINSNARIESILVGENCGSSQSCIQCVSALMGVGLRQPKNFHANINYTTSPQVSVKVTIDLPKAKVDNIPLLSEICTSTGESGSTEPVRFDCPCPVWGLVSLLLILDGAVSLQEWLGDSKTDPLLPAHTLEMADFLRLEEQRLQISTWMHELLKSVAAKCQSTCTEQSDDYVLHNQAPIPDVAAHSMWMTRATQVLASAPYPLCETIFSGTHPPLSANEAMSLPPRLLCIWLRCQGLHLDLRKPDMTSQKWASVLASLAHAHDTQHLSVNEPSDIRTISAHLQPPPHVEDPSLWREEMQALGLRVCRHGNHRDDSRVQLEFLCIASNANKCPLSNPLNPISVHKTNVRAIMTAARQDFDRYVNLPAQRLFLTCLDAACLHLNRLQRLDLHKVALHPQNLTLFSQLMLTVSSTLEELSVWNFGQGYHLPASVIEAYCDESKKLFFNAVGMLHKLQCLQIRAWPWLVGWGDGVQQIVAPLQSIRSLQELWVNHVPPGTPEGKLPNAFLGDHVTVRVLPRDGGNAPVVVGEASSGGVSHSGLSLSDGGTVVSGSEELSEPEIDLDDMPAHMDDEVLMTDSEEDDEDDDDDDLESGGDNDLVPGEVPVELLPVDAHLVPHDVDDMYGLI